MIIGLGVILYAGWNIVEMKQKEKENLAQAKEIVSQSSYNQTNDTDIEETDQKDGRHYFNPEVGDVIGILHLPSIDAELPIIEGTNEEELAEGVGHYRDSAFPDENDQILLSGHRDTVFRRVGDIQAGDELIIELPYGTFTYEMVSSKIVSADDTSIIRSTYPEEELVLSTCYPFHFIGNAPDRYIIYAKRIK